MLPGKNRGVLEANLSPILKKLATNKKTSKEVEERLAHYKILPGEVRGYLNSPDTLFRANERVLCLLTEAIFVMTGQLSIKPFAYFSNQDIQDAHIYDESIYREREKTDFPIVLDEFFLINKDYRGMITAKQLKILLDNQLLNYNFDTQREAVKLHKYDEIIYVPKLVQRNVDEMSELLKKGKLKTSEIVFNATFGTALDGREVIYDDKKHTLTIMPGTRLDIVDGYHRCQAVLKALSDDPDINFAFSLIVMNVTVAEAQEYLVQSEKRTPMSIVRRKNMDEQSVGDRIVDNLKNNFDLEGKISDTVEVRSFELVNSLDLSKYISKNFSLTTGKEISSTLEYLNSFFTELVSIYPKELGTNVAERKKTSYINHQYCFAGYIKLAAQMMNNNIDVIELPNIIEQLNITNEKLKSIIKLNGKKKAIYEIEQLFNISKVEQVR